MVYFNSKQIVLEIWTVNSSIIQQCQVMYINVQFIQCLHQIRHYPQFQHLHEIQDWIHIRTSPYMARERTHICMKKRIAFATAFY